MNSVNPNQTSLLFDPWCFDTPLSLNPTLNCEILWIFYFILHDNWDIQKLWDLFGDNVDCFFNRLCRFDANAPCHWIWTPKFHTNRISSMTYHFLNHSPHVSHFIWNLRVAPCAQHFIWLTLKGKIATHEYLYSINLGPHNLCSLCGLDMRMLITFQLFAQKLSLSCCNTNMFIKSIIADAAWFTWKNRCEVIFRQTIPNYDIFNSTQTNLDWRFNQWTQIIKNMLNTAGNPYIHHIPKDWLSPATKLAIHGRSLHVITPFSHGRDLPIWVMKSFELSGFKFQLVLFIFVSSFSFSLFQLSLLFFFSQLSLYLQLDLLLINQPLGYLFKKKDFLKNRPVSKHKR